MLTRRQFLPVAAASVTLPTLLGAQPAVAAVDPLLLAREGDRVLGKAEAPITIVEYASFTCPHCAHFANKVLPEVKKNWIETGKAKLVYRDFPLDRVAYEAAILARAVPGDRYFAFIDTLFAQQEKWATAKDTKAALSQLAKLAGLGAADIEAALANKAVGDAILAQRLEAAEKLKVDSTPTLFINGKKADHGTYESFSKALSAA